MDDLVALRFVHVLCMILASGNGQWSLDQEEDSHHDKSDGAVELYLAWRLQVGISWYACK